MLARFAEDDVEHLAVARVRHGCNPEPPPVDERPELPRIVIAALGMGGAVYIARFHLGPLSLQHWLAGGLVSRIAAMAILIALGMAVFAVLAQLLGAADLRDLRRLLRR